MTPTAKKQKRTLSLLRRQWLTSMQSALKGGCMSLSQRVSVWRRAGYVIDQKTVVTDGGSRVAAYRLLSTPRGEL